MRGDYLSEKQKRRRRRQKYSYYGTLFVIIGFACWGCAWIILRSPLFRIDQVVVKGNVDVSSAQVVSLLDATIINKGDLVGAPQNGLKAMLGLRNMLIWPSQLPSADLALVPQLASVAISKNYFSHTVTATVAERAPFGIWCLTTGSERCYWFDDQGIVFGTAFDTEGSLLLVVRDGSQTSLALGQPVLPEEFVPNLISILRAVQASGIAVSDISLTDMSLEQVNVTTADGPAIYFSLRFPADDDLPVLQNLMKQSNFSKLQYIDFTVQNRAYYK